MKKLIALLLSLCLMLGLTSALAYDGEVITLRVSSDDTFTFDPETDPMATL